MNFLRTFSVVCKPLIKETKCKSVSIFKQTSACYSVKIQHRRPVKVYDSDGVSEIRNPDEASVPKKIMNKYSKKNEIQGVVELNKDHVWNRGESKTSPEMNSELLTDDETDDGKNGETTQGTRYIRLGDSDKKFE